MGKEDLILALESIRDKIKWHNRELERLHHAEQSFILELERLESSRLGNGQKGKRIQRGLPKTIILEFLGDRGPENWESIQDYAKSAYGIEIPRSTILGNLRRLQMKGEVKQSGDDLWELEAGDKQPIQTQNREDHIPPPPLKETEVDDDDLPF